ncbi:hypothetical protein HK405_007938 [Cladochytrium tenue]|nr:hypothetical protein HK405_007938 [Cladochytrium tenue]
MENLLERAAHQVDLARKAVVDPRDEDGDLFDDWLLQQRKWIENGPDGEKVTSLGDHLTLDTLLAMAIVKAYDFGDGRRDPTCRPAVKDICVVHSTGQNLLKTERVRAQVDWRIDMPYEQRLLVFNARTLKLEYVYVKNGYRTRGDATLVAISHLWPEPFADDNERKMYTSMDLKEFGADPFSHAHELYQFNSKNPATAKGWVRDRIAQSIRVAEALASDSDGDILVWLDVVCINQSNQLDVRDATYAMSIVYHIADITAVLVYDVYNGNGHWHQRRWTLQELELSHWISFFYTRTGKVTTPRKIKSALYTLEAAITRSSRRFSKYPQDIIYAVRGLVPALFELPAVYDVSVDELVARAALIAARRGDYSMIEVNERQGVSMRMVKNIEAVQLAKIAAKDENIEDTEGLDIVRDLDGERYCARECSGHHEKSQAPDQCLVKPSDFLSGLGMVFQQHSLGNLYSEPPEDDQVGYVCLKDLQRRQKESLGSIKDFRSLAREMRKTGLVNMLPETFQAVESFGDCMSNLFETGSCYDWAKCVINFRRFVIEEMELGDEVLSNFKGLTRCVRPVSPGEPVEAVFRYTKKMNPLGVADDGDGATDSPVAQYFATTAFSTTEGAPHGGAGFFSVVDAVSPDELDIRAQWLVQSICSDVLVQHDGKLFVLQHPDNVQAVCLRRLEGTEDGAYHGCDMVIANAENRPFPVAAYIVTVEPTEREVFVNTVCGMTRFCRPQRGRDLRKSSHAWNLLGLSSNEIFRALVAANVGRRNPVILG